MATDHERRRRTLRLAAQYVERRAKGEAVTWSPTARVTRLDADGNPEGEPMHVGPVIMSGFQRSYSFPDADDEAAADPWRGAPGLSDAD